MESVADLLKRIPITDITLVAQWLTMIIDREEYLEYGITKEQILELGKAVKSLDTIISRKAPELGGPNNKAEAPLTSGVKF